MAAGIRIGQGTERIQSSDVSIRGVSIGQKIVAVALSSIVLGVALVAGVGTLVCGAVIAYYVGFPIARAISDYLVIATFAYWVLKAAFAVFSIMCIKGAQFTSPITG